MYGNKQYEIEETVLGCLLSGGDFFQIQSIINVNDFSSKKNKQIYSAIEAAAANDEPYDAVSLLDKKVDISAIQTLLGNGGSITNLSHYAKSLAKMSNANKAKRLLVSSQNEIDESNVNSEINKLQIALEKITHAQLQSSKNWSEIIQDSLELLDQRAENHENIIVTGLDDLDGKLAAIHGSRLVIIAARPSVGKTALAQQIALCSAKVGRSVGIISLEMNYDELAIRSMANCFELNVTKLSKGDSEEVGKFFVQCSDTDFLSYKLFIDDSTDSLTGIISKVCEWKRKHNIDFVIIDHIGLIDTDEQQTRNDMLGKISRSLKKLCKRLEMPIIVLSQMNRSAEREKRSPMLSDLRDSGNIEQDADTVIFMQRTEQPKSQTEAYVYLIELYVAKNRNGTTGWLKQCQFNGRSQKFTEYEESRV